MKATVSRGGWLGALIALAVGAYLVLGASRGDTESERPVSPEQQTIIADGVVTDAESLDAARSMVSCLRDAGLGVSDPERGPQGQYSYRYLEGTESPEALKQRNGVVQGCYLETSSEVDRVKQQSRDFQNSAEELGFAIQRCVESNKDGFRFSSDRDELIAQVTAFQADGDAEFLACWSAEIEALFAAGGITGGAVNITYSPIPR